VNVTWLYVACVYAAAVALMRRARVAFPWWTAGLFYALVLAYFWKSMTGPYVNVAADILQFIPPWSASAPSTLTKVTASNYELQDVLFQIAPWFAQVRASWLAGHVPLWNDLTGCGYPLAANMQSEAFAPLRILALPLALGHAIAAEAAMKVLVALTGAFLFCRRKWDVVPSLAGAIAFGFGTAVITWVHFSASSVCILLPLVLLQLDLLAESCTFGRFAFATALGPAAFFGGHPETAAHLVFFGALYALWLRRDWRWLRTLACLAVVAMLLAAPLLAPFLESMHKTARYQQLEVRAHGGATAYSDLPTITPMIQPRFFGTRPEPLRGPAISETVDGFAGLLGIGAWFGLVARMLLRRRFRDTEAFLVFGMLFVMLVLADVDPVAAPFRALFALALNFRMRLVCAFLAAAATAALLDSVKRESLVPLWIAVAGAIGVLAFITLRNDPQLRALALPVMIPSAATLLAALLFARRAPAIVVAVLFVELWANAHYWNPARPLGEFYPRTPLIDALLQLRGTSHDRIAGIGAALFPNTNAVFGLADVRVHDPMSNGRYLGLLANTTSYNARDYYAKWQDAETPLLDYLNVRWLVTEPGVALADRRLLYDGADGRIYENLRALPRFFAPRNVLLVGDLEERLQSHNDWANTALVRILPNDATIGRDLLSPRPANAPEARVDVRQTRDDAYELHVDAPRYTLIVSSVSFWPGWRVTHNGHALRALQVNGVFLGFVIPPGRGVVKVAYVPWSFWGGVVAAGLTVIALMICRACSTRPGSTPAPSTRSSCFSRGAAGSRSPSVSRPIFTRSSSSSSTSR